MPAYRFLGREGRVAASVWLLDGEVYNPFSIGAYRVLDAGEKPGPIVYRNRHTTTGRTTVFELALKLFDAETVSLALVNPAGQARRYTVATPLGVQTGVVQAGERRVLTPELPAGEVSMLKITVEPDTEAGVAPVAEPTLEVLLPAAGR